MSADILYEKKTWNVGDLKTKIEASSSSFTRFTVVRITHVKDLANWVWHEYIQVIVRDSDTSKLIRLIAERQTDNDHLIIGRWKAWKEGDTPPDGDGDTNYPLALLTLEFNNTRPSLETFVWLLSALHDLQPKYNVLTANCYWYALAVYYNLFTWYKNTATERKWTWWFYRYLPPSYILWWDCVTVPLMRIAASAFKSDDMKDKSNPKIITFDRAKIPHSGNTTDHPPNPVAVAFWLAIQQRGAKKTETNQSTAVAPTLPTRNLTAEEIQANLPVASQFAGTPNPVSYPDGITGPNYVRNQHYHEHRHHN
ncbi:hypothetical protein CALCODRAFT_510158 [Calocera cornea HHB12733]|uniref:Uncharacterized protein n=1 Tax=Calocera cornea HHB12733 TaxID=1353952 RepID=A0A165ER37_9BASI|nr:hypothetical protein CALCODRAFT_510158 [Calocera cornea HHB12733]